MADTTEQARELSAALRAMRGPWLGDGHRKIHAPDAADTIDALAAKLEQMREADILARYSLDDGRREWVNVGTWLHPGEVIAHMDGASLAQEPAAPAPAEPSAQVAVPTHPERYYRWTGREAEAIAAAIAAARLEERERCAMEVWYAMQEATADGADDKGLEGWMREAEQRIRTRA